MGAVAGASNRLATVATPELVEEVCAPLAQDGIVLRVVTLDDSNCTLELDLDLSRVECLDCVMPAQHFERVISSRLEQRVDRAFAVRLIDPRVTEPSASPLPLSSMITVLDPTATGQVGDADPGPDAGSLVGKLVLFRVDILWRSWDWVVEEWTSLLEAAGVRVWTWARTQGVPGVEGRRRQAEYEGLASTADVLVSGLGNCGSCTSWTVRDAVTGLSSGIATAAVATEHFVPLARVVAEDNGRPGLRILSLPYPLNSRPEDEVRAIAQDLFPALLEVLGATV